MTPSVTFLRLSDASVICRVTYAQFSIQSAFLQYIAHYAQNLQHFTHVVSDFIQIGSLSAEILPNA